ncbi:hypothetical protein [Stappia sp.]|jgi:hypothetical protein|uniref:hypothetical protein n=1 Tax=Stappia sp. TaxID=1870903 RepID=UPI003D133898
MPGSPAADNPAVSPRARDARPGLVFYIILISAIALFGAEVWTMTLGFLWALSGILSLGPTGVAVVAALLLPAATLATWKLAVMAFEGERDLLRQPPTVT